MTPDPAIEVRYWPADKPIPDGWAWDGRRLPGHHGEYSILIVKEQKPCDAK